MPLLRTLQRLIERTYDLPAGRCDAAEFVIGDRGLAALYGASASQESRPRLLVRFAADEHRVRLYYPDRLIANLERHDPCRGLSPHNLRDLATFVEELDHLLLVVEAVSRGQRVRPVELELHANVTKMLVVSLFLARTLRLPRLEGSHRALLRFELFGRGDYDAEAPDLRERYRAARLHALRFLDRLERTPVGDRTGLLRRFSRAPLQDKLALCG